MGLGAPRRGAAARSCWGVSTLVGTSSPRVDSESTASQELRPETPHIA